jgi:glutaredoxin
MNNNIDWKKYLIVFLITASLFLTAGYLSNYFTNKKVGELKSIQDKISIDILSSETQFSLLQELSCKDVNKSALSSELSSLADKIAYSETNIGASSDIIGLKKYYSLLEIKDHLLMQKISERCGIKSVFVLYFYANKDSCPDCVKEGYALDALRAKYPEFRVYSFDYNLDLSAIKALISIYKIPNTLPALVINREVHPGFTSMEEIEKMLPALEKTIKEDTKETKSVAN